MKRIIGQIVAVRGKNWEEELGRSVKRRPHRANWKAEKSYVAVMDSEILREDYLGRSKREVKEKAFVFPHFALR